MAMTAREAFERGTEAFNAHDIDGFADVLADDVAFKAPGGVQGQGKAACAAFFASWLGAFPDAHVDVRRLHVADDVAIEEGVFTGTHASFTAPRATFRRRAAQSASTTFRCFAIETASMSRSTGCSIASRCSNRLA